MPGIEPWIACSISLATTTLLSCFTLQSHVKQLLKINWAAESKHCIPRWENHKKGARGLVGTLKWECQSKGKKEMFLTNGVLKLCQEKSWWYKDLEEIIYHKGKTHCKYFMVSMRWGQQKESKSSLDSGAWVFRAKQLKVNNYLIVQLWEDP